MPPGLGEEMLASAVVVCGLILVRSGGGIGVGVERELRWDGSSIWNAIVVGSTLEQSRSGSLAYRHCSTVWFGISCANDTLIVSASGSGSSGLLYRKAFRGGILLGCP